MRILITGANRGIGAELLRQALARGDDALGTSRTACSDLLPLDVTEPASIKALADHAGPAPIDLLICNAGVFPDRGENLDVGYSADLWAQGFAANVTGVFLTIQALLPQLRQSSAGKIAIISSQMASHTRAPGGNYIYRASKAAALNLGRNLASDLRAENIAVGIYHPGWVQTDMGGKEADITEQESAAGLLQRFDQLDITTTGCFETWDGRAHPY